MQSCLKLEQVSEKVLKELFFFRRNMDEMKQKQRTKRKNDLYVNRWKEQNFNYKLNHMIFFNKYTSFFPITMNRNNANENKSRNEFGEQCQIKVSLLIDLLNIITMHENTWTMYRKRIETIQKRTQFCLRIHKKKIRKFITKN